MLSRRVHYCYALFLCVALLSSCAGNKGMLVSGKTIIEVGNQFVETGKLYDNLFTTGKITAGEYKQWAIFANRFKMVYPAVADSWKAATNSDDAVGAANAILALKNELLQFFLTAQNKQGGS